MTTVPVPQRQLFWQRFDIQYQSTHPDLPEMRRPMWELPHWMHWLGGTLQAHGYSELDVLDFYTEPGVVGETSRLDPVAVERILREHPADCYLFSPMTVNLHFAQQIAQQAKAIYPSAHTVFGGVVATPLAELVASHPAVDYVIAGRGERALPALLDALAAGVTRPDTVGHLVYSDGTRCVRTPFSYPDVSPADMPWPKVDLFPPSAGGDIRYLRQVYALGCPYQCTFCTIQTIGRKPAYFPVERVLAEIRAYRDYYGAHHNIYFGDETFTLHRDHTLELLAALAAEGDIGYDCQTRLNCLTDSSVLDALRDSGCRWVEIGLETGVQESLDAHKHRMKLRDCELTLERIRDAGLAACAFTVNGFPDQSLNDMRRSLDWVASLIERDLLQASYLFGLVPYPGSAMYADPQRFGMNIEHHDYSRYHEDLPPVFSSAHATPDQAYEVFLEGLDVLADAMGKQPYFGGPPTRPLGTYGSFWADAHV
ncbi:B12-binding domain-containing radical SAM protein [Jatrophihabitans lederbergiae]|uniref:B12-binding domain-containing radical SAM protein n=1 Tax=Jatrophihabitans lederbergiae TaxID=3075547 RepID=A0ABU2JBD6_9ACTN|nr:B12-binding domain-containing radical SAM protein [Jatrophihabitans sp. DSM 44399]MDT0262305.1 B12-binding domain-containing radical SAM protein [Jatrophihabitans sp. DSM 44399]